MQERVKIFTFVSGHGETVLDSPHEEHLNHWLQAVKGEVVNITQSESVRSGNSHHVTVCIWYVPQEPAASAIRKSRRIGLRR
jgi:hypothetical protein